MCPTGQQHQHCGNAQDFWHMTLDYTLRYEAHRRRHGRVAARDRRRRARADRSRRGNGDRRCRAPSERRNDHRRESRPKPVDLHVVLGWQRPLLSARHAPGSLDLHDSGAGVRNGCASPGGHHHAAESAARCPARQRTGACSARTTRRHRHERDSAAHRRGGGIRESGRSGRRAGRVS